MYRMASTVPAYPQANSSEERTAVRQRCFVLRAGGGVGWVGRGSGQASLGREDYDLREIAQNREEYLPGHGESPGRWYGAGAAALGQDGIAATEALRRMFE